MIKDHAILPPIVEGIEPAASKNAQPTIGTKMKSATAIMKKSKRIQMLLVRLCKID
jgi:hypothetical protein